MSLLSLVLSGCALLSAIAPKPIGTGGPISLVRCDPYPSALCLRSFGLEQNQLLITFYFPAAGDVSFYLKVYTPGQTTKYPCAVTQASSSTLYCTGPLIDLGTAIKIELYSAAGQTPLAQGDFTLIDLALPTLQTGASGTTPGQLPGTAYPNLTPP